MRDWLWTLATLLLAAILEAGGDALVRYGLRGAGASSLIGRIVGFGLGATVLFIYALCVNAPKWDFGQLLGIYIVLFFVVSQVMAAVIFNEHLKLPTFVAGFLIVAGGLLLTFWRVK